MSLFTKIRDIAVGAATSFIPGGAAVKAALAGAGSLLSGGGKAAAAVVSRPGVGLVKSTALGVGAAYLGGKLAGNGQRSGIRRRGRGFSARDIRQQRRLVKMLKEFNAVFPKHRAPAAHHSHH